MMHLIDKLYFLGYSTQCNALQKRKGDLTEDEIDRIIKIQALFMPIGYLGIPIMLACARIYDMAFGYSKQNTQLVMFVSALVLLYFLYKRFTGVNYQNRNKEMFLGLTEEEIKRNQKTLYLVALTAIVVILGICLSPLL